MTTVSSTTSSTTATSSAYTSTTSDVDWSALIEAAVQVKLDKADAIDVKITSNEAKVEAYETMQSLLQDLADAADALRAPSGYGTADDDVFRSRAAYLTANGDVDESSAVSVTVESGSALGSYDLEILQLAEAHKVASGTVTSNADELGYDGVVTLGVDGGDTVDVTIDADMTLDEIAEAVNAETDTSGITASVIKVADSQYKLVLTASDTGKTMTAAAASGDDVLALLGITDATGAFANELQAAQDAVIELDGIEITRDSNDVDAGVDGVTFHLYATTPDDTSIAVEVGTNLSDVKEAIQALVDAYNAYREWALTQQETTTAGVAADGAILFGDGTLRNVNSDVADALTAMIDELSMADIGLSFDESNALLLDEDTLDDTLLDDLESIQALLSFDMTSSSSDLTLLARGASAPTSFTLDVTIDGSGAISAASVDGDSSLFTISGTRIIGAEGSDFEGFTFVFLGEESESVDVTLSYGLAELVYGAADTAADESEGTLQSLVDDLEDVDADLEARAEDIRTRAETYRTNLTVRYATIQAELETAQSMLDYLEAYLGLMSDS